MGLLTPTRTAQARLQATKSLGQSCALQTVDNATGAETTTATVDCRVEIPRASGGGEWLGDPRSVDIVTEWDAPLEGTDLVVVDGATAYRVESIRPARTAGILRRLAATESREPGGPI